MTEQKEERIVSKGELLYVSVREPAKAGQANRRVVELLRLRFGADKQIHIVSGHHSPHKIVSLD